VRLRERYWPIIVLFVALRLMVLATFPADNLTLYGDYVYYYELAAYSDQGYLPFIHYWSEYPPVFPFLSVGVYQLARRFGGDYHVYVYLMGLLMLAFNTASLVLFLRLARRLRGDEAAERLGWVYSVLFVPLVYTWWNFDALTLFSLLLALELLLCGRERWSAVVMGVGALIKLVPLLLFPAVVRVLPERRWLAYGLVVAAVVGAVALPLLVIGGPMAMASFRSPTGWSSWQTVWALLDGNLCTGLLGAPADHFDLAKATTPVGNPAWVSGWISLVIFGLIYAGIFWKARLREASVNPRPEPATSLAESARPEGSAEPSPRRLVSFVCITFLLFFLWSKGWSPQWQTLLFPLLLLVLPLRRSVLFILALSFVNLAEWPVLLSRGLNQWLYLTVPLRTGLFVLLVAELWPRVKT
jgi:hypothetical protein